MAANIDTIQKNPKYQQLIKERSSFAWVLSILMLAFYLGFILLVAYAPKLLGQPLGAGVTTLGIPVGLGVIVSAFVLTGIYVAKANSKFDELTRQIVEESK